MRVSYDDATNSWGPLETVLAASEVGMSILEPRVSPDGRRVLVSMCEYGSFPVFQQGSDLYFVDPETGKHSLLSCNSDESDSWHSWSSNGRWIVFASNRLDGLFGRLFFAHVKADGEVAKPFLMPQENPRFYETCYQNYNAPELAIKAVGVPQEAFLKAIYEGEDGSREGRSAHGMAGCRVHDARTRWAARIGAQHRWTDRNVDRFAVFLNGWSVSRWFVDSARSDSTRLNRSFGFVRGAVGIFIDIG